MQISKGVEWAAHACALMCALPSGKGLRAAALAEYHGVPGPYMAKQLQALSRAGIVHSSRGKHGGYWLAKPPDHITLWDIMAAIEGRKPAFRCTEIRQNGPCATKPEECRKMCAIAASFAAAETAFRDTLQAVSLSDIARGVLAESRWEHLQTIAEWLKDEAVSIA